MPRLLKNSQGIGFLELILSLVVIVILLIFATRYFTEARRHQQIEVATQQIHAIAQAYHNYYSANNHARPASLMTLIENGYLAKGEDTNPWGGQNTVTRATKPQYAHITFNGLPPNTADCNMLKKAVQNLTPQAMPAPTCVSGVLSGDF